MFLNFYHFPANHFLCMYQAKKAAESFEKTSTAIQSTLHQSDGSQNVIKSGEGDEVVQVVVKNKAAKLAEEPIVTNKSTIKIHGLEDLPDESVVIAVSVYTTKRATPCDYQQYRFR